MQLFRTEMLFLHPPQPVAPRVRYGRGRGTAPRYGHARMRPSETPVLPAPPAAMPKRDPAPEPDLQRDLHPDPQRDLERAA
jgi:hypothetical protein